MSIASKRSFKSDNRTKLLFQSFRPVSPFLVSPLFPGPTLKSPDFDSFNPGVASPTGFFLFTRLVTGFASQSGSGMKVAFLLDLTSGTGKVLLIGFDLNGLSAVTLLIKS